MAGSVAPQRISLSLMGGFAVAALVIACIGVYGVVAYWVALRSREMAIRMALGASAQQVTRLVAGETMRLVTTGAVLGVGGAIGLAGLARSQLYETSATDPLALAGAGLVLVLIGLAAGVLPSRRASRVSPVDLLRAE